MTPPLAIIVGWLVLVTCVAPTWVHKARPYNDRSPTDVATSVLAFWIQLAVIFALGYWHAKITGAAP